MLPVPPYFQRGSDLVASRTTWTPTTNDPETLVWTATAQSILAKVERGRIALKKSAKYRDNH